MEILAKWFVTGQLNVLSVVITLFFVALFSMLWSQRGKLRCTDLITGRDGMLSRTAIGQTCGILIAVWTPVYSVTYKGTVEADVLALCLTYLAVVEGYAKYLRWKADLVKGGHGKPGEAAK